MVIESLCVHVFLGKVAIWRVNGLTGELSNEYQYDRILKVFENLCFLEESSLSISRVNGLTGLTVEQMVYSYY